MYSLDYLDPRHYLDLDKSVNANIIRYLMYQRDKVPEIVA